MPRRRVKPIGEHLGLSRRLVYADTGERFIFSSIDEAERYIEQSERHIAIARQEIAVMRSRHQDAN